MTATDPPGRPAPQGTARAIAVLAIPAFFALVAEPLFLIADSAIVGHLGTAELAGLGVASAVLTTAAGVFVFLAYATTSIVARLVGAGQRAEAAAAGVDGLWLALILGVVSAAVVAFAADPISAVFGAGPDAHDQAVTYLRVAALGIPAMLVVLAVTGALRGFQDTRTVLVAAAAGFGANVVLNLVLVYGVGLGIAGSAWGTVIAQTGMALGLVIAFRRLSRSHASGRPQLSRVLRAAAAGLPLLVRTLALRAIILLVVWAAAAAGDIELAGFQITLTLWNLLAFALDALAIAAQALVGEALGAGDRARARELTSVMIRWAVVGGLVVGVLLWLGRWPITAIFTEQGDVRAAAASVLWLVAVGQLVSGYVFVADGLLMGAGDTRYLAGAMVGAAIVFAPLAVLARGTGSISWVWAAFLVAMVLRAGPLWWRLRRDGWLVTGATR